MGKFMNSMKALVNAAKAENYEPFDNQAECLEYLEEAYTKFVEYANLVISQQISMQFLSFRLEGEDYRQRVMQMDQERRTKHNSAVSSADQLNRLHKMYGLEPFAVLDDSLGELEYRHQVAQVVGQFCCELYNVGIGEDPDAFGSVTYNKDTLYDTSRVAEVIHGLC